MATRIYTKTGDKGTTGLFSGQRVAKHHIRVEAYGTVDELNSIIGLARTCTVPPSLEKELETLSVDLFVAGSDLATPIDPPPKFHIPRITLEHVTMLERWIDAHDEYLPRLRKFILPGGTPLASYLHQARTVCRRAERRSTALAEETDIGPAVVMFLNRLSDYLFTAARAANYAAGIEDIQWISE
ncbi:MAG: cob(I)yrinic acid a,c-diamide adenosyltransferase [Flavobacteriales bacterium]|nr:cob(I)yrinic acid a,c-diamide adenosyltransferase [Flavobacteriales bacterium]